jgi:polyhydroxybutyrate depolymerase
VDEPPNTRMIAAAATVVIVVVASAVVIAVSLRRDPPTTAVDATTVPATIPTSTTAPSQVETTVAPEVDERQVTVEVAGRRRSYLAISPRGITDSQRLPLAMVLHGLGVDAVSMSRVADWRRAVEQHRFHAVFPQGVGDSWNMGPCCPPANLAKVNDLGFLDRVLQELRTRNDVDPERLFLTGFSNGGIMTYAYACARPGMFAAIAPMAGSNISRCFPAEPLSILHQHSDPDGVVPYDGAPTVGQLLSAADFPDVPTSVGTWAELAGCEAAPVSEVDADGVERFRWPDCPEDLRVELVRIPGRGHSWPKLGSYDPLEAVLEFFRLS